MKVLFGLVILVAAQAQEFEAASVKPAPPPTGGRFMVGSEGGPGSRDPTRIRYFNIALKELLARAYGVKNFQIFGPSWLDSERFEVTATMAPGTTKEQFEKMLQNLLADRFKLTLHHEQKELPAYVLGVGKRGPKMKVSEEEPQTNAGDPAPPPSIGKADFKRGKDGFPEVAAARRGAPMLMMMPGKAKLTATGTTMQQLCEQLSRMLAKPVMDHTELTAKYDFVLYFSPEQVQFGGPGPVGIAGPDGGPRESKVASEDAERSPTIFAAVQDQLGLKLDSQKTSVDLLVVDRVERVPTEN